MAMAATRALAGVVPATMTAVRLHEHGGPEVLQIEQVPTPEPGPGEVLMRVRASAINWWDLGYRRGVVQNPRGRPLELPFQLGREGAGEVAVVGAGVDRFAPGDRVVLMTSPACGRCDFCKRGLDNLCTAVMLPGHQRFGSYAEYVLAPEEGLLRAPDGLAFDKLACVLWSYATALHMVESRARVQVGDVIVISGASGGMGTACIQLSRLAGAGTIIALSGSPAKHDALRAVGADLVLDPHSDSLAAEIVDASGGLGADAYLDNVGGDMASLGVDFMRMGGRMVWAAVMAGRSTEISVGLVFRKHLDILGTRAATRREQERVLELAAQGLIDPIISERYPLREAEQAHIAQESADHFGKIVLLT